MSYFRLFFGSFLIHSGTCLALFWLILAHFWLILAHVWLFWGSFLAHFGFFFDSPIIDPPTKDGEKGKQRLEGTLVPAAPQGPGFSRRAASTRCFSPMWSACTISIVAAPRRRSWRRCRCRRTTRLRLFRPWQTPPSILALRLRAPFSRPTRSPLPAKCRPWTT